MFYPVAVAQVCLAQDSVELKQTDECDRVLYDPAKSLPDVLHKFHGSTSSPYGLSPLQKSFSDTLLSTRYADVSKKHCVNLDDIRSSPQLMEEMLKPLPKKKGGGTPP